MRLFLSAFNIIICSVYVLMFDSVYTVDLCSFYRDNELNEQINLGTLEV